MAEKKDNLEENPHKDHRKRLKKKFLDFGLDGIEDHELVELLLFYAIPIKNTNETAHRLIREYGRFSNILLYYSNLFLPV